MKFIVKLFPEITIKSKPVRKRFIQRLQSNIQIILRRIDPGVKVSGQWDKIVVNTPSADENQRLAMVEALQATPGITHFLQVDEYPLGDFHDVFEKTRDAYADRIAGKTFVVRVKRSGKHEFTSTDLERYVGGGLRQHTEAKGVDLRNPEVTVQLEVRDQLLYVVNQRYPGQGGYPMGSQEAVLSLISGGFDSTVSSYLTMKRGCKTHFLFFNLGGAAHETGVKQVSYYLWQRYGSSHRVKFITVPFEKVVEEILTKVHHSQMGVVLKRMMLRAATEVAERMKVAALVTGESLAQVSSQTLPNLKVIDEVTDALVLRPLITSDKQDIIDLSKVIGTFEFAETMPEYCGVISDKPTTCAKLSRIVEEETAFDDEVLAAAVADATMISIDEIVAESEQQLEVATHETLGSTDVVIDIRHPDEEEKEPLELSQGELVKLPFYQLQSGFAELDSSKHYLLWCPKGVMSRLHALYLKEQGFNNIGVYRPKV